MPTKWLYSITNQLPRGILIMANFAKFADAINKKLQSMSSTGLYEIDVEGQILWEKYLESFPAGTNKIFRVNTKYDSSYDRNVLRRIGKLVTIKNGQLDSIFDIADLEYPFDVVVKSLSNFVKQHEIVDKFITWEKKFGFSESTELCENGKVLTWYHFYADIPQSCLVSRGTEDTRKSDIRTTVEMAERAFNSLTNYALTTVKELIRNNAIYRGQEFKSAIEGFSKLKASYDKAENKKLFLWSDAATSSFARFKNTVIGTLVSDMSDGIDIESAVKSFEAKVAPSNYKRPTALVTQAMIDNALKTIQELGIESALQRRHSKLSDISVNNVLWINNEARKETKEGLAGLLAPTLPAGKLRAYKQAQDISVQDFFVNVIPKAAEIEVMLENALMPNLMSLTAPVDNEVEPIFKWNNNFAWSYNGEIADADIRTRVKAAGGSIDAPLRVSLSWANTDDLDIHAKTPRGHIYFGDKQGVLDVDMNASSVCTDPVENLAWKNPTNGKYVINVHQYRRRNSTDTDFTLELQCGSYITQFHYSGVVRDDQTIKCLTFEYEDGQVKNLTVEKALSHEAAKNDVWGIQTQDYVPVSTVMFSPNHWDNNNVGNKHYFFILKGCTNPDPVRGIYNEFLRQNLDKHRKVFELLGSKTHCPVAVDQLSGLGFSTTRTTKALFKVTTDKSQRFYNVIFKE